MSTEELILAFRLAKEQNYISSVASYANCISNNCETCPATKACSYLATDKESTRNYDIFKNNFDILVRPYLRRYSLKYIKKHYPELFV